jgi:hypothetical protein
LLLQSRPVLLFALFHFFVDVLYRIRVMLHLDVYDVVICIYVRTLYAFIHSIFNLNCFLNC